MKIERAKTTPGYTGGDIRAIREAQGWSQEEAARWLGVSVHTLSRWENGHAQPSKLARVQIDKYRPKVHD